MKNKSDLSFAAYISVLKDLIIRSILAIVSLAIVLCPLWLFLLIKSILEPTGFLQNLLVYGLGFYFLMGIQFVLIIIWFAFLFQVILKND